MTTTRPLRIGDAETLALLLSANREFLAPWSPSRPDSFFTAEGQRVVITDALAQHHQGAVLAHVILDRERIVGRITLSRIVHGGLDSCNLGYWVAAQDNGRGHATEAVRRITDLAFGELALQLIQAGTLPHNRRSQRVLERNGFQRIGLARAYLQIAGRWQDHILYQRCSDADG